MGIKRFTIAVAGLILLFNILLYFVVKIDGASLILTVAFTLMEVIAMIWLLWYWENHISAKHTSKFHHLP